MAELTRSEDPRTETNLQVRVEFPKRSKSLKARWQRLKTAYTAVKALFDDPEDTEKVFTVISSLRGDSLEEAYRRFKATPTGSRVLRDQVDLLKTLQNRDELAQLGAESFGAAYLEFVKSQDLTADGLVDASYEVTEQIGNSDVLRYTERVRDMHDLWHTLTRYGREPLGEACLLAFTYAQLRNPGVAFILVLGTQRLTRGYGRGTVRALLRAHKDGKRARWLAAESFEDLLSQDIEVVRENLGIPEPTAYWSILDRHGLR